MIEHVNEVRGVFGAYDILAGVKADNTESLRRTITWKIRSVCH